MALSGLTDTKEGRLAVICLVAGTLMIGAALGNLAMAGAADDAADDVRAALRRELATVSDESIALYPSSAADIERTAVRATRGEAAHVLGSTLDDGQVTVAVQSGWGWQIRCIEAQLRGDATVLTYVSSEPC